MFLVAIIVVILVVGAGCYFYYRHRVRTSAINYLLNDPNLLAHWTYAPHEWRQAVEEEFTWSSSKDSSGEIYISPTRVYVKSHSRDRLIDLAGGGKVVTHASFSGIEGIPLKLRVRWKVVRRDPDRGTEVKYYKEDYRFPVPASAKEAAAKVANYFNARLENNLEAYTAVVPEDQPISLFGKDEF